MQITVSTTAVPVATEGRGRPVIQNLGPGDVYLDSEPSVTIASGLKLEPGDVYEFDREASQETGVSLISDSEGNDVRVIFMGV